MKGNLLIIDDEIDLTDNLKLLLAKFADNVFVAYDGEEGLKILEKETIHCIVCDIYMPKVNGIEVIKKVREEKKAIPFVFFTAYGLEDLKKEILYYTSTTFFVKPDIAGIMKIVPSMLQMGLEDQGSRTTN